MTPVGRAMERGAKKSAQYLVQIGKFSCKPNFSVNSHGILKAFTWAFKEFIRAIIHRSKWFKNCPVIAVKKGGVKVAGHWLSSLWCVYRQTQLKSIRKQGHILTAL